MNIILHWAQLHSRGEQPAKQADATWNNLWLLGHDVKCQHISIWSDLYEHKVVTLVLIILFSTELANAIHSFHDHIGWHQDLGTKAYFLQLCYHAYCTRLQQIAVMKVKTKGVISATKHCRHFLWTPAITNTTSEKLSSHQTQYLQFLWQWHTNMTTWASQTKYGTGVLDHSTFTSRCECFSSRPSSLDIQIY